VCSHWTGQTSFSQPDRGPPGRIPSIEEKISIHTRARSHRSGEPTGPAYAKGQDRRPDQEPPGSGTVRHLARPGRDSIARSWLSGPPVRAWILASRAGRSGGRQNFCTPPATFCRAMTSWGCHDQQECSVSPPRHHPRPFDYAQVSPTDKEALRTCAAAIAGIACKTNLQILDLGEILV
jgi:hypothetical protein